MKEPGKEATVRQCVPLYDKEYLLQPDMQLLLTSDTLE